MAEFLGPLVNFLGTEQASIRIIVTLLILVFGHIGVRLTREVGRKFWITGQEDLNRKRLSDRQETLKYASYLLDAGVIVVALVYLNQGFTNTFFTQLAEFLPQLLSAILIGILGIIAIQLLAKLGENFLRTVGAPTYLREVGLSQNSVKVVAALIKSFLYLILLQIALTQLGIGDTFIRELVNASSWAAAFLVAGLLFYGFKDLFQNYAAGIYLKNSRLVRPGEEVKLGDNERGEIRDTSLLSTLVETDKGYTIMAPNAKIMNSELRFKRTKNDVETLEDMKNYFVAQHPAYCGPASMEMALDIFGFSHDQDEIGEKANTTEEEGTEVEDLMETTEKLTDDEVKCSFIEYDKISDLKDEFKTWFNDGALVIPNFYKPELFPDATTGHYVLSVGVEGDEILVVDPSAKSGGVYYVNSNRLYDAMGDHGHKRGYIVVAPEGTTAYWRIKNDLTYSEKTYYDELSKTLENRLRKLIRQGKLLRNVMPNSVEDYMDDWHSREKITRIWEARGGEDDKTSDDN